MGEEAVVPLRADLFEETRVPDAFEERAAFAGFPDAPDCADEHVVLAREVFGDAAVHELRGLSTSTRPQMIGRCDEAHL